MLERLPIEERQVAGEHEPGGIGMARLRGHDAGDGPGNLAEIDDLREARAQRVRGLVGPNGNEDPLDERSDQLGCPLELAASRVLEHRLVALHARTAAAGEHQAVKRRPGGAGASRRRGCDRLVHIRFRILRPRLPYRPVRL